MMTETSADGFLLFDQPYYIEINEARWAVAERVLCELRNVGLKTCIDVACGPGWFADRLVQMGLSVIGIDGRAEIVAEARKRVPGATFEQASVEVSHEMAKLQPADLVFCFGALYHVENPFAAIRNLCGLSRKVFLIETMLIPRSEPITWLVEEGKNETQGLTHYALIPSLSCLLKMLQCAGFAHLYEYVGKVAHADFIETKEQRRRRGILIASHQPLSVTDFRPVTAPETPKFNYAKGVANNIDIKELHIRALHELLPQALCNPGLAPGYAHFARELREQQHPRGVEDLRRVETCTGIVFDVDVGDRLGCDFYYGYFPDFLDYRLFVELAEEGSTVLDVGANFGIYTLSAAKAVGCNGIVHAFEPHPGAHRLLSSNVMLNRLQDRVQCHQLCIGSEDGETEFHIMEESSFSGMQATGRSKEIDKIRVGTAKLDSLRESLHLDKAGLMKIDVEGAEAAVLDGAKILISQSLDLVILMEVSVKNLTEPLAQGLETSLRGMYWLGFRGWIIRVDGPEIVPLVTPTDVLKVASNNIFLFRRGSAAEERVGRAFKRLARSSSHGYEFLQPNLTTLLELERPEC